MKTFENFYYTDSTKNALAVYALKKLTQADNIKTDGSLLILLTGQVGTGKSHIMNAVHNAALPIDVKIVFASRRAKNE